MHSMEVVTDAVPSRPRPRVEKEKPREQEQAKNGPPTPTPQDKPKTEYQSQGPSDWRNTKSSAETVNNYSINNCNGFVVGSVININQSSKSDKNKQSKSKSSSPSPRRKFVEKLIACPRPVDDEDLVIVAGFVDPIGLLNLGQHLGMEVSEINKIDHNYAEKGIQEKVYQTLKLWKEERSDENQSAMLNILCDKLWLIRNNGGEGALKELYRKHLKENVCDNC